MDNFFIFPDAIRNQADKNAIKRQLEAAAQSKHITVKMVDIIYNDDGRNNELINIDDAIQKYCM